MNLLAVSRMVSKRSRRVSRKMKRTRRVTRGGEFRMANMYRREGISPNASSLPAGPISPTPANIPMNTANVKNWNGNTKPKTWKNRMTMSNATRKRMNNALFRMTPSQAKKNWIKNKAYKGMNLTKRGAAATAKGLWSGTKSVGRAVKGIGKTLTDPIVTGSLFNLVL